MVQSVNVLVKELVGVEGAVHPVDTDLDEHKVYEGVYEVRAPASDLRQERATEELSTATKRRGGGKVVRSPLTSEMS